MNVWDNKYFCDLINSNVLSVCDNKYFCDLIDSNVLSVWDDKHFCDLINTNVLNICNKVIIIFFFFEYKYRLRIWDKFFAVGIGKSIFYRKRQWGNRGESAFFFWGGGENSIEILAKKSKNRSKNGRNR